MRTKEEIQQEVNASIKTLTQPTPYTIWKKGGKSETIVPEAIEGKRQTYSNETRLLVELLLDIREALTQPNNK